MAFVDLVKGSGSKFPVQDSVQPRALPRPVLYPYHQPSLCSRCFTQFNPSLSLGGLCPACSFLLPTLTMQQVQGPVESKTDVYRMSDVLHVIDDVLKEQEERDGPVASTQTCVCGVMESLVFCAVCQCLVCTGCLGDHESTHQSSPTQPLTNKDAMDDKSLESCVRHPERKAELFCHQCERAVCQSCACPTGHPTVLLSDSSSHYQPLLENLLSKAQVETDLVELSLSGAQRMSSSVGDKKLKAIREVGEIFAEHRALLEKREQEIVAQINTVADLRVSSLAQEITTFHNQLSLLKSLSTQATSALTDNKHARVVASYLKLSECLHKIRSVSRNPSEDDSFIVLPNRELSEETVRGLCVMSTSPHPPLCTAMGEGLYHPRIHRLCTVTLSTKDRQGHSCLRGGERLFVQLKPLLNGGSVLPVDVRDNYDGSYSINFKPRVPGEHQLVIAIRGQHVQSSPFTLVVDGGRQYSQFGVVSHVFGSEGSGKGQFCKPWGIACDHHGNLLVGDRTNHRVQVFDSKGNYKYHFGSEGNKPGQFNRPAGLAITREGNVVVADKDNHRVQVLKLDGTFLFKFGSKGGHDGQMIYPYDVAVNQHDGRIAVTDTGNHRLLIFNHDGVLLGKFGYKGYLCGHFESPRGIAFNDEGHIIVSDFNVHHILVIHPDGTTARILGSHGTGNGQFFRPQGIATDHMGNYIVADTRNNRVVVMQPNGHVIAKFGSPGSGLGQFDRPTGLAVMPDGRIAVVDFGNSRVQIF